MNNQKCSNSYIFESLFNDIEKNDLISQLDWILSSAQSYAYENYSSHQWLTDISAHADPDIPKDITWPEAIKASLIYLVVNEIRKN